VWVVLGTLIAFLVAAPYTLLDLPHFLNGFARLASEYRAPSNTAEAAWIVYLKQLRIALQWPGSLIALAGIAYGALRAARGPDRLKWTLALVFVLMYFGFVSRQNILFARYLLPLLPPLSLLGAAGIVSIADWTRRVRIPVAGRQGVIVALTLVAIVPPAYASIQFDANEARVWTIEQAYRWILRTLPERRAICIEGSVTFHLPAAYNSTHVVQLRRTGDAASFRKEGIQYLVASSQIYGPYVEHPDQFPEEYGYYRRLFDETKEVVRFTASPEHPGPELRILEVK
jgi:hypothetical protein